MVVQIGTIVELPPEMIHFGSQNSGRKFGGDSFQFNGLFPASKRCDSLVEDNSFWRGPGKIKFAEPIRMQ